MKALSIRQPWAWLITHGYKDVENRNWTPGPHFVVPQRIFVHAGIEPQYVPSDLLQGVYPWERHEKAENFIWNMMSSFRGQVYAEWRRFGALVWGCGAIVGEVDVMGFDRTYPSRWAEVGQEHWILANPVAYADPIPYKGRQGLFEVDKEEKDG